MTEECKECKVICVECRHCQSNVSAGMSPRCLFYSKNEMNCVTGKMEPVYANCNDYNKDGKCKGFILDENKASRRKLLFAVTEECRRQEYQGYPDYYRDILIALQMYLEGNYSVLGPFCHNPSKKGKC